MRQPSNGIAVCAAVAAALGGFVLPAGAQAGSGSNAGKAKVEAIVDQAVNRLWVQSDRHWHEGEYNHVVNTYKVAASARPNLVEAYANGGYLLWSMDRDEEAVALYETGIKHNPDTFDIYDELGFYYFNRKKDYPRAIGYYEKAVVLKDCQPHTLHMLGHAYERTKQPAKALKIWERAAARKDNLALDVAKRNVARLKKIVKPQG